LVTEGYGQILTRVFHFLTKIIINSGFCLLLALTSPTIEKAYDTGIIRIYEFSETHWWKFSVHTLCYSRDRAFFLLQCGKTAFLEMELFSLGKIGKTALSQHMNTKLAPQCYRGPVDSYDPHIIGLFYIG